MAKIYGQLEKAQMENSTSDTGSLPKGMMFYRTDLNLPKVSNGTIMKTLVDTDTAQTLSTKTLSGAIVGDPTTWVHATTPSTPSAGSVKLYFKSDDRLYKLPSSGVEEELAGFKNTVTDSLSLASSGTLPPIVAERFQTFRVQGASGPVTLSTTPFGASPPTATGSIIAVVGNSDDNPVTIPQADIANGCLMDGDVTLLKGQVAQFMWLSSLSRYVRISR